MWDLKVIDTSKSLYLAIADALERDIQAGLLRPGDILPTHRGLAHKVGVTVTTATRAYAEAEKRGLISAVVGKGTFVAVDACCKVQETTSACKKLPFEMGQDRPLRLEALNLRGVVEKVLRRKDLQKLMGYADPEGLGEHREIGAEWIRRHGVPAEARNVLVTAGGQHGVFTAFSALFQPGDRLAVDQLTCPGAKAVARRLGLRLEGVRLDAEGMVPEELDALCSRHSIKGVYTVGRRQNPTNQPISPARRAALAQIIHSRNLILIENDTYGFLCDDGKDQTLAGLLPANSVYISSVSKAFYAGLRVAFVAAPAALGDKIAHSVADNLVLASPLCVEIICQSITSGTAAKLIKLKQQELKKRVLLFQEKLRGQVFNCSEQTMFAWLRLPGAWTASEFERSGAEAGLRVYGADKFAVGHIPPPNCIRVAISGPEDLNIFQKGISVLTTLLHKGPGERCEAG